jgi:gliding motility-associated-like protein
VLKPALAVFFLTVTQLFAFSQVNCKDTFYHQMLNTGTTASPADATITPANESYAVGITGFSTAQYVSLSAGFITKMNEKGQHLWTRRYFTGQENYQTWTAFTKVVYSADNHLIVAGSCAVNNYNTPFLSKIDLNGNVIWTKTFNNLYQHIDFQQLADGGFFYVINSLFNTALFDIIGKLDNNGNEIWSKMIRTSRAEAGYIIHRIPSLIAVGNTVYVSTVIPESVNKSSSFIFKMNGTDGTIEWQKHIADPNFSISLTALNEAGGKLYYQFKRTIYPFSAANWQVGRVAIDFDGNITQVKAFNITPATNSKYFTFSTRDVTMASVYYHETDKIGLIRVDLDGNTLWKYNYATPTTINIEAIVPSKNGGWFLHSAYSYGNAYRTYMYSKVSADGKSPGCNVDDNIDESVVNITLPVSTGTNIMTDYDHILSTTTFQKVNISFAITHLCKEENVCSTVSLAGSEKVCSIADTVKYVGTRTPGCQASVSWDYDPSFVSYSNATDTTLSLVYKKSGNFRLISKLNTPCPIADTVYVDIQLSPHSVNLGPDTALCENSAILFNAGTGFTSYLWQNGSTALTYNAQAAGIYHVAAGNACGNVFRDTVEVLAAPPVLVSLGADLEKCNQDTIAITAPDGFISYSWSPGYNMIPVSNRTVNVFPYKDTSYIIKVERSPGCFGLDTIAVKVNLSPQVYFGGDTGFCKNESVELNAAPGFTGYQWSNGAGTQQTTITQQGIYYIEATYSNNCVSRDTVRVTMNTPFVSLGKDTAFCRTQSLRLDAAPGFSSYLWSNGSTDPFIVVNEVGQYWLQVTDDMNCVNRDTIQIDTKNCTNSIYFPDAFTPNGDNNNDLFRPIISGQYTGYKLIIYNRWGQKVFESTDAQKGWNGTIGGIRQDTNIFVWHCQFRFEGQPSEMRKGTLLLVR